VSRCETPATFTDHGLPRRFQALRISARDADVGAGIGETSGDFRPDAP
jgi:hypothetical protein